MILANAISQSEGLPDAFSIFLGQMEVSRQKQLSIVFVVAQRRESIRKQRGALFSLGAIKPPREANAQKQEVMRARPVLANITTMFQEGKERKILFYAFCPLSCCAYPPPIWAVFFLPLALRFLPGKPRANMLFL